MTTPSNDRRECQVCGRLIKAPHGRIALHGYKRPGDGWQTSSCIGAKYEPYDVACDALFYARRVLSGQLTRTQARLVALVENPPETLTERTAYRGHFKTWTRPYDFLPAETLGVLKACVYPGRPYERVFVKRFDELNRVVSALSTDLEIIERRLARWEEEHPK